MPAMARRADVYQGDYSGSMSTPPVNLVAQVTQLLRQDIVDGRLEPGERLTEARLSERYGVSRVPVREALRMLEGEGFIATDRPRMRTVAVISDQDADDLFTVRVTVEGLTAARAAQEITPEGLRTLRSILAAGQEALATGRTELLPQLNTDLHRAIAAASGSAMLVSLFNQISGKIAWIYRGTVETRAPSSWAEHAEIVGAIMDRDPDRARDLVVAHIERSRSTTLRDAGAGTGPRAGD